MSVYGLTIVLRLHLKDCFNQSDLLMRYSKNDSYRKAINLKVKKST